MIVYVAYLGWPRVWLFSWFSLVVLQRWWMLLSSESQQQTIKCWLQMRDEKDAVKYFCSFVRSLLPFVCQL